MAESFTIRPFEPEDAPEVAAMMDDFRDYLVSIDPNGRLRRLPGFGAYALKEELENTKDGQGIIYVAVQDKKAIGFSVGFKLRPFREEDLLGVFPAERGRIEELYVASAYRGMGVASALMSATETYLKSKGCDYLFVGVHAFNQHAHELYAHLGYEDIGIDLFKKLS
jgi:ribosomal protein S18 acetylase RimI-like enzyme